MLKMLELCFNVSKILKLIAHMVLHSALTYSSSEVQNQVLISSFLNSCRASFRAPHPVHTLWLNAFHADAAGQGPDELAAAHGEEAVRNLRVLLRLLLVQNARCLSGR